MMGMSKCTTANNHTQKKYNEQTGGTEVGVGAQGVHGAMPGPAVDPLAAAAAGATPAGMAPSAAESESKPKMNYGKWPGNGG